MSPMVCDLFQSHWRFADPIAFAGVANFFQDFPSGSAVQTSLGLSDEQLAALPTNVLNIPPYGNWTDQGWNVRFHGNVYKQPNTTTEKLNDLANVFLIGTDIQDLPASQQDQARNLTASIFVVQQGNETVSMHLEPAPEQGASGQSGGSGAVTPSGGEQNLTLPYNTTGEGDFDVFLPIANTTGGLLAGNETQEIQRLNVYANGSDLGNATAYLVPPTGLTVISDIDDILRVTKIYQPKEGLLNSFARPFTPWLNMPSIYQNWSDSLPNMHFHYLTTTPEQVCAVLWMVTVFAKEMSTPMRCRVASIFLVHTSCLDTNSLPSNFAPKLGVDVSFVPHCAALYVLI